MTRYAISDIHGNYKALKQVLELSNFDLEKDELIVVGDVCDGYLQTYEVVEQLLKIKKCTYLFGNHDLWFMECIRRNKKPSIWTSQGGSETLKSYKKHGFKPSEIPISHLNFFHRGKFYLELDKMLFVHGGFDYPNHPKDCDAMDLVWDREFLHRAINGLQIKEWNKVFLGHTTTEREGSKPGIFNFTEDKYANVYQIDCGAGWKGRLCLFNIDTDKYFLSDYAKDLYN